VSAHEWLPIGVQADASASLAPLHGEASDLLWPEIARRAEDLGYDVLSMPDHLDVQIAPLVAQGYSAALTQRIALATTVLANDVRNPCTDQRSRDPRDGQSNRCARLRGRRRSPPGGSR
jgi:alkanesulfonate monooxygenase SsuD/methylene tetrahydromethanopterin reductase-like flavin-dependent oxidoreductase (luciferase family)